MLRAEGFSIKSIMKSGSHRKLEFAGITLLYMVCLTFEQALLRWQGKELKNKTRVTRKLFHWRKESMAATIRYSWRRVTLRVLDSTFSIDWDIPVKQTGLKPPTKWQWFQCSILSFLADNFYTNVSNVTEGCKLAIWSMTCSKWWTMHHHRCF